MLREEADGKITFEYDPGFRTSGLEISPIHLPAGRRGPVTFPELARKPAFLGLPGVFADALPDQFGNSVIRRYFEERGIARRDLLEVGEIFDVPGGGREIVAAVEDAVGGWREQACAAGVRGGMVEWVEGRVGIVGSRM